MSGDPGDLANLRDLALPASVSFWPPAAGIWIVAAAGLAMLLIVLWRAMQHYRAMAYRRAAIAELRVIAAGSLFPPQSLTGHRKLPLRHPEERAEAASRSTQNGCASFETPAPQAPQDDEGGSFRPGSRDEDIGSLGHGFEDADVAARVSAVMKRVAMVEYGRERVASLTGKAWLEFVAEAAPGSDMTVLRRFLAASYAAPQAPDPAERHLLVEQATRWVRTHRMPAGSGA